jgi:hypothetical protein
MRLASIASAFLLLLFALVWLPYFFRSRQRKQHGIPDFRHFKSQHKTQMPRITRPRQQMPPRMLAARATLSTMISGVSYWVGLSVATVGSAVGLCVGSVDGAVDGMDVGVVVGAVVGVVVG